MPKVVVLDNVAQEGLDLLAATDGIEYEVRTGLKGDELKQTLTEFDAAVCRSGVKLTADVLEGNRRLKAIARAGVGTDNIDKPTATRLGIVVMNTPGGNTVSTAEHAFALMLGLSRNLAPANQSLVEGRWDKKAFVGAQLAEKTLGIVGLGRIGREMAQRAKAFEMRVIGYDPMISGELAKSLGIDLVDTVDEMLPDVDYLTVHTPLTAETKGLIGKEQLDKLKPGVRLINCARGGIYDEQAVAEGLESGKLAGVALDVYASEPCTDSPLFGRPDTLCTPHLGASTEEAQTRVAVMACQLVINFLKTGEIRHAVNVAAMDPKTIESIKSYLDIAYRLGLLMAQCHTGTASSCKLTFRGELADKDTNLLAAAFCAGWLETSIDGDVSIINSQMLLKERGIELEKICDSRMEAFRASITAQIAADQRTYGAGATSFGHNMPRLMSVDDYRLESYLDGTLLIFVHKDAPGVIGSVGAVFGRHNVNIAQMSVGRVGDKPGGEAVGVIQLDSRPPERALQEVEGLAGITSAKVVELPPAGQLPPWL
jgi:D-3-phosphoglycerate dehydrogenase